MKKTKYFLFAAIFSCSALFGCSGSSTSSSSVSQGNNVPVDVTPVETSTVTEPTTEEPTTPYVAPITITLSAVGDMLMHASASFPAVKADGSYNYDYLFDHVRTVTEGTDLAIANNEVIFGGNELGNIGYPTFNVRTELGNAEVNAGFDVILSATNHTMDQNASGIINCFNFWRDNFPQISWLGSHDSVEDAGNITVRDVNGIKVALLNYTYGLNGFELPQGYEYAVDLMNEGTKPKIADDIKRAGDMADFVIVFPHWGTEYNMGITQEQTDWAKFFAECGADLIIGTHPHVVEPVSYVTADNGNTALVYYSLGNFVSVQYYNFSMLGGMARVSITKDSTGCYVSDYGMDFLVTHYTSGRSEITTYFLNDYTDELAAQHAILFEPGQKYMDVNQSYPFNVAGLKALAKSICPDLTPDY